MRISELVNEEELNTMFNEVAKMVWGRAAPTARGGKTKLRFRCSVGPRAGRQVSHPSKCVQQYNVARAQKMKTTRALAWETRQNSDIDPQYVPEDDEVVFCPENIDQ